MEAWKLEIVVKQEQDIERLRKQALILAENLRATTKPYGGPNNYEVIIIGWNRKDGLIPISYHCGALPECIGYLKAMEEHGEGDCHPEGFVTCGDDFIVYPEEHWGKLAKVEIKEEWERRQANY